MIAYLFKSEAKSSHYIWVESLKSQSIVVPPTPVFFPMSLTYCRNWVNWVKVLKHMRDIPVYDLTALGRQTCQELAVLLLKDTIMKRGTSREAKKLWTLIIEQVCKVWHMANCFDNFLIPKPYPSGSPWTDKLRSHGPVRAIAQCYMYISHIHSEVKNAAVWESTAL